MVAQTRFGQNHACSGSEKYASRAAAMWRATSKINLTSPLMSGGHNSKDLQQQVPFQAKKNPSRGHGRRWPQSPPRRPPAAAGPRCRGLSALHSAARCSLGAPAEVAEAEGPVNCMVRWFFPSETMPKRWKSLLVWPKVWDRLGNLLLHHIHISRLGI